MIISPIFYMGNKKKLIKKGLIDLFPKNIDTMIDLFGGSAVVSMNTVAKRYYISDIDSNLVSLYQLFKYENSEKNNRAYRRKNKRFWFSKRKNSKM